ncbi:MAG: hypothetical protein KDA84_25115, partial [Planctomycetaceae bacterium]|nr:hypothetical protein [Planctomycetaceae bacterium]
MNFRFWIILLCLICFTQETSAGEPSSQLHLFPKTVKLQGRDARQQLLVSMTDDGGSFDVT